ncbi:DUF6221 family protein [Parafrankia discariae]|uniref:DUF6221 family protein n=1 Tax=Parafrankia discariae TaxID=365528 RepID=UPI0003804D3C|nr:DUF6221 family protein [Parafrankia discariae]
MTDLRTRILARLDQLEQTARDVPGASIWNARQVAGMTRVAPAVAEHIAQWSPARVLPWTSGARELTGLHHDVDGRCATCLDAYPCPTLSVVARTLGIIPSGSGGVVV